MDELLREIETPVRASLSGLDIEKNFFFQGRNLFEVNYLVIQPKEEEEEEEEEKDKQQTITKEKAE